MSTKISTTYQLLTGHFLVTSDIDVSGSNHTSIGTKSAYFGGVFDGGGHSITISLKAKANSGLFGYIKGTPDAQAIVRNVTVKGSVTDTYGYSNIGGVCGGAQGYVLFSNVANEATIKADDSTYVGGILGRAESSSQTCVVIEKSSNSGAITSSGSSSKYFGGIVGGLTSGFTGNPARVVDCYNAGAVSLSKGKYAGGIVGEASQSQSAGLDIQIENCFSYDKVSAKSYFGGVFGVPNKYAAATYKDQLRIANCYGVTSPACSTTLDGYTPSDGTYTWEGKESAVKTPEEMKTPELLALVNGNGSFAKGDAHPVLKWQVGDAPVITTDLVEPENSYHVGGATASLVVEASLPDSFKSTGALSYAWLVSKNGSEFQPVSEGATVSDDGSRSELAVGSSEGGTYRYRCVVSNAYGSNGEKVTSSTESATVTVRIYTGEPAGVPVVSIGNELYEFNQDAQGCSLTATVSIEGNAGELGYSWRKMVGAEPNIDSDPVVSAEQKLSVDTSSLGEASYYCVVSNSFEDKIPVCGTSNTVRVVVRPYTIMTADDLIAFSEAVAKGSSFAGKTVELGIDIDMGGREMSPIGYYSYAYGSPKTWFMGAFDGKGFTISNINVKADQRDSYTPNGNAGLFGYMKGANAQNPAIIQNLTVTGIVTASGKNVGGLIGNAAAYVTVKNVGSEVGVKNSAVGEKPTGGLIGQIAGTTVVEGSYARGIVAAVDAEYVGGLSGMIAAEMNAEILNCYSTGKVIRADNVGGLIGGTRQAKLEGGTAAVSISNCYSASQVECQGESKGAIVWSLNNITHGSNLFFANDAFDGAKAAGSLEVINDQGPYHDNGLVGGDKDGVTGNSKGVSSAALKSTESVAALNAADGAAFKQSNVNKNDGYPILAWEPSPAPAPGPDPEPAPGPAPSPQQFAVTYHLDGGVNAASNPATFAAGTEVALAAPTKEGYEFAGWYADASFKTAVTSIPATANADVELYAKWAKKAAPAPTFPDVDYSESSWYGEAVTYVAGKGLITGYASGDKAGQFGVGDALTRAQLATILWRNACPDEAASYDAASAKDTTGIAGSADGQYYTAAANWAVKNGVISGFVREDGTKDFAAGDDVSFEQLVTILARLCATPEELAAAGSDLSAFSDGADASGWSRNAFAWAASKGLVEGYDTPTGKLLSPGEDVARERVAVVLMRAFEMGVLK